MCQWCAALVMSTSGSDFNYARANSVGPIPPSQFKSVAVPTLVHCSPRVLDTGGDAKYINLLVVEAFNSYFVLS